MASYVELVIDQGTTYNTIITVTDSVTGLPSNLTSFNVSSQMRKSYYSSSASATFTCLVTDAPNGNIQISLSASQTSNISPGGYVFDVITISPANVTSRILEGLITLTPRVTR